LNPQSKADDLPSWAPFEGAPNVNHATSNLRTRLGEYHLISLLDRGPEGEVYYGFHPEAERPVAMKTVDLGGLHGTELEAVRSEFFRQARLAQQLKHPNIAAVYDFGEEQGVLYFAEEFLAAKSLQQVIEESGRAVPTRIRSILEQICGALGHAHGHGVIHLDLRPENVFFIGSFVLGTGAVKLTDFCGKIVSVRPSAFPETNHALRYMSPEQLQGGPMDRRSNIFSLGAILYELASGERAFAGQNDAAVIERVIAGDFVPPLKVVPSLDPVLAAVIVRALARTPGDRYQTCQELLAELWADRTSRLGTWRTTAATDVVEPATPPKDEEVPAQAVPAISLSDPLSNRLSHPAGPLSTAAADVELTPTTHREEFSGAAVPGSEFPVEAARDDTHAALSAETAPTASPAPFEPAPLVAAAEPASPLAGDEPAPPVAATEPSPCVAVGEQWPPVAPAEPAVRVAVAEPSPPVSLAEPTPPVAAAEPAPLAKSDSDSGQSAAPRLEPHITDAGNGTEQEPAAFEEIQPQAGGEVLPAEADKQEKTALFEARHWADPEETSALTSEKLEGLLAADEHVVSEIRAEPGSGSSAPYSVRDQAQEQDRSLPPVHADAAMANLPSEFVPSAADVELPHESGSSAAVLDQASRLIDATPVEPPVSAGVASFSESERSRTVPPLAPSPRPLRRGTLFDSALKLPGTSGARTRTAIIWSLSGLLVVCVVAGLAGILQQYMANRQPASAVKAPIAGTGTTDQARNSDGVEGSSASLAHNPGSRDVQASGGKVPAAARPDAPPVKVIISSSVPGAQITLDGYSRPDWVTPFGFLVRPGLHRLVLSKRGYERVTREFDANAGGIVNLEIPLRKIASNDEAGEAVDAANLGDRMTEGPTELAVSANVHGARISVDGRSSSNWVAPMVFRVHPGRHVVTLSKSGYESFKREINVETRHRVALEAALRPRALGGS
jgi:serine/threonine-protein kinase